jgi:hypothetical protein
MKMGPDALGTVGNESGIARHENGTRRPRIAEKLSGRAKQEIGTRRPQYLRKRVRERKI